MQNKDAIIEQLPEQVDQVIEYELRDKDAQNLIPLDQSQIVQQRGKFQGSLRAPLRPVR